MSSFVFFSLVSLCVTLFFYAAPTSSLFPSTKNLLPPSARLFLPGGGAQLLRQDCEAYVATKNPQDDASSIWADNVRVGYEIASQIFSVVAFRGREESALASTLPQRRAATIWLPHVNDIETLSELADILTDNSMRLGGVSAKVEGWPSAPANGISLCWSKEEEEQGAMSRSQDSGVAISEAIAATEAWVDDTLGGFGLCPYTISMRRAAVGLDLVGVKEGPVLVRHACSINSKVDQTVADAALLAVAFWDGVVDLATKPEEDVATFLLVAPSAYDDDFSEFVATCDGLLERTAKVVNADDIIGKAWFHPRYDSSIVGQDKVLPGHALPAKMVKEFVDNYYGDDTRQERQQLDIAAVAKANDAVRHTPHATVNLLRRSQLRASKEAEAAAGAKKPNLIYARNAVRLITEGSIKY